MYTCSGCGETKSNSPMYWTYSYYPEYSAPSAELCSVKCLLKYVEDEYAETN